MLRRILKEKENKDKWMDVTWSMDMWRHLKVILSDILRMCALIKNIDLRWSEKSQTTMG